jgi:hypothetical protein
MMVSGVRDAGHPGALECQRGRAGAGVTLIGILMILFNDCQFERIYRAFRKYSNPLFHILLCYSLNSKWIKYIFVLTHLDTITHDSENMFRFCMYLL